MAVNKMAAFALSILSVFMLIHVEAHQYPCEFEHETEQCYTKCTARADQRGCPADRVRVDTNKCYVADKNGAKVLKKSGLGVVQWYQDQCSERGIGER